jgi:hypothetical protein
MVKWLQDHWIDELLDQTCLEKEPKVVVTCRYSNPNAKLRWFKNRLEVFHGHKYSFEFENDGTLRLVIYRVTLEDTGQYTCQVDDRQTSAFLTVDGLYWSCKSHTTRFYSHFSQVSKFTLMDFQDNPGWPFSPQLKWINSQISDCGMDSTKVPRALKYVNH